MNITNINGRYFTGRPCKRGHVAERYRHGACVECGRAQSASWYAANSAKGMAANRKWAQANPGRRGERAGRERATVCNCCTNAERTAIYDSARMLGAVVDHIIPICAGGIHCVANLQVLSAEQNREKHTRYDPLVEGTQYLRNLGLA